MLYLWLRVERCTRADRIDDGKHGPARLSGGCLGFGEHRVIGVRDDPMKAVRGQRCEMSTSSCGFTVYCTFTVGEWS